MLFWTSNIAKIYWPVTFFAIRVRMQKQILKKMKIKDLEKKLLEPDAFLDKQYFEN